MSKTYTDVVGEDLSRQGWSWAVTNYMQPNGRLMWVVDAHREDGHRHISRAETQLGALLQLKQDLASVYRPATGKGSRNISNSES